jgi:hypothetical protein
VPSADNELGLRSTRNSFWNNLKTNYCVRIKRRASSLSAASRDAQLPVPLPRHSYTSIYKSIVFKKETATSDSAKCCLINKMTSCSCAHLSQPSKISYHYKKKIRRIGFHCLFIKPAAVVGPSARRTSSTQRPTFHSPWPINSALELSVYNVDLKLFEIRGAISKMQKQALCPHYVLFTLCTVCNECIQTHKDIHNYRTSKSPDVATAATGDRDPVLYGLKPRRLLLHTDYYGRLLWIKPCFETSHSLWILKLLFSSCTPRPLSISDPHLLLQGTGLYDILHFSSHKTCYTVRKWKLWKQQRNCK